MKKLLCLIAIAAIAAPVFALDVRFDQGVDVTAILRSIGRGDGAAHTRPSTPEGRHIDWVSGDKMIDFEPGQTESASFELNSIEVVEACGAASAKPRCHREFGRTVRRVVRLFLVNRPASDSTETFDVWLTGEDLTVNVTQSPFEYDVKVVGGAIYLTAKP
jgi:hypothetical protein